MVITGGPTSLTYQILNPTLGLVDPTDGNPIGQTSIQGAVTDTSAQAPEPTTMALLGAGLALVGVIRSRRLR